MELAQKIIDYQKRTDSNDAQLAFEVHLSVEKIHAFKNNEIIATEEEKKKILDFIKSH